MPELHSATTFFLWGAVLAELFSARPASAALIHRLSPLLIAALAASALWRFGDEVSALSLALGSLAAFVVAAVCWKTRFSWRVRICLWLALGIAVQQMADSQWALAAAGAVAALSLAVALLSGSGRREKLTAEAADNPPLIASDAAALDALLPQWQCGRCGYPGCAAYAEALVQGAPPNRCAPGGAQVADALAAATAVQPIPVQPWRSEGMMPNAVAVIREAECIGCTKCIQACPTGAIVGARRMAHAVIADLCTGCDLCLPPCPTDCIDLVPTEESFDPQQSRVHFASREARRNQAQLATSAGVATAEEAAQSSAGVAAAQAAAPASAEVAAAGGESLRRRKVLAAIGRAQQAGDEALAQQLQQRLDEQEAQQ